MRSSLTLTFVAILALAAPIAAQTLVAGSAAPPPSGSALAELRRERAASVVGVTTRGYRPVAGHDSTSPRVRYRQLSGSGFAISGGLIVTSSELLVGAERVDVVLPARGAAAARTVAARLVGVAPEVGVALLAIESDALPSLPLASDGLTPGQAVFALSAAGAGRAHESGSGTTRHHRTAGRRPHTCGAVRRAAGPRRGGVPAPRRRRPR